jgi:hypothetical protein
MHRLDAQFQNEANFEGGIGTARPSALPGKMQTLPAR